MRWLLAVGAVVLAVLLWQLRSEVAAPTDDHSAARAPEADEPDEPGDTDDTTAPAEHHHRDHLTSKRAIAAIAPAKPFDPWADPGPLDPRVPHLDDVEAAPPPEREHAHMMMGIFRAELARNKSAIRRCYHDSKLETDLKIVIGVAMVPDADDKLVPNPYVKSETDQPLSPELATCIGDVIRSMELPTTLEDGRPYSSFSPMHLTHDTVD